MRLNNTTLAALATVVCIATAATVLALDHVGIINLAPPVEYAREQPQLTVPAPVAAERPQTPVETLAEATPDVFDDEEVEPAEDEEQFAQATEESLSENEPDGDESDVADNEVLRGTVPPDTVESWVAEIQQEIADPSEEDQSVDQPPRPRPAYSKPRMTSWSKALTKRLAEIGPGANARLAKKFESAGAAWPPHEIALVAIKDEKLLELFARPEGGEWKFVHRYPVLAASGRSGPKLRQGDKQVPEGIYGISFLNPNSRYHVSLRVNYPNAFDRRMAEADGRTNLGGDIMIHGKAKSVGCLAIGDEAAEELFVLAAEVGLPNIKLIIAPTDFRRRGIPTVGPDQPKWVPGLYTEIALAMSEFKSPPRNSLLSFFFGN